MASGATKPNGSPSRVVRGFEWVDDRVRMSSYRSLLNHIFPDHWSFMLGELAMYSFIFLIASGIFLSLYFVPSQATVVYHGSYLPLRGETMTAAYRSTLQLSFAVRAGLLMRQAHHWAADIFIGSIIVHMMRVFFTGGFRKPREMNWAIGATMLALAIANGFIGYSLPGDLVSGIGLRIAYSIAESIPLVGSYLAVWVWGGVWPGTDLTKRFFILHVLIVPAIIAILLGMHLFFIWRQEHTQFKSKVASETTITGTPLWPAFIAKTQGFMFMVFGVILGLGALVQINPIWQFGPLNVTRATDAAQPDWYMGWLEGALRLYPPWETVFPGHMIAVAFYPTVLMPGLTWLAIYLWPYLEARFTGDHDAHHILDHPRDRPVRTAFGVGIFTFYFLLEIAGGDDVLANFFHVTFEDIVWGMRIGVLVMPFVTGLVAWKACKELSRQPPRSIWPRHVIVERAELGHYTSTGGLPVPKEPEPEPFEVRAAGDEASKEAQRRDVVSVEESRRHLPVGGPGRRRR